MIHKEIEPFSLARLSEIAKTHTLYVWGAGNQGRGITQVLTNQGIAVGGIIDGAEGLWDTKHYPEGFFVACANFGTEIHVFSAPKGLCGTTI